MAVVNTIFIFTIDSNIVYSQSSYENFLWKSGDTNFRLKFFAVAHGIVELGAIVSLSLHNLFRQIIRR